MSPSDIIRGFGRAVAYYPALTKYLGGVNATVLFCQFTYWMDKTSSDLGVHKSAEEVELETGLSYEEQLTARKKLRRMGVLVETHKRLEHKIYYRIDFKRVDEVLTQAIDISPNGESPIRETVNPLPANTGMPSPPGRESLRRGDGKAHFDPTEITTEITTDIKPSCPDASLPDEKLSSDEFLNRHPEAVVFSPSKRIWGSQEDLTCAKWIWGKVLKLYEQAATFDGEVVRPKEPNWIAWANDVRLMRMLDGRSHKQICELFKRTQNDPFWIKQVKCPAKLREKWDDLVIRLGAHTSTGRDVNQVYQPDSTIPPGFRG